MPLVYVAIPSGDTSRAGGCSGEGIGTPYPLQGHLPVPECCNQSTGEGLSGEALHNHGGIAAEGMDMKAVLVVRQDPGSTSPQGNVQNHHDSETNHRSQGSIVGSLVVA